MKQTAWCVAALLVAAGVSRAQEAPSPTTIPAPTPVMDGAVPKDGAAPAAPQVIPPAVPTPCYYPDWNGVGKRRHPLCLWATYVPSRRPWFDGHCCQLAPNVQPPLYDYFPCLGEGCYDCKGYVQAPPAAKLGMRLCRKTNAYCAPGGDGRCNGCGPGGVP